MMKRTQDRLLHSLLALALLLCVTLSCQRWFGPKDKGGIYMLLAVKADKAQMEQAVEETMNVIKNRCDQMGVYCKTTREGAERIRLNVSGSTNAVRAKEILLNEGLELRAVVSPSSPVPVQQYSTQAEAEQAAGADKIVLPYDADGMSKRFIVLERTPIITGQQVRRADAVPERGAGDNYQVFFSLNSEGANRFLTWTRANINRYLAIILNKKVRSVAYIKSEISDSGVITGRFNKQQAEDAAMVLMTGNLPAPVEVVEEGTYNP